jgi:hypothetical protein
MRAFQLKSGQTVLVDDEDFDRVSNYRWHVASDGYVGRTYRANGKINTEYLHQIVLPGCAKVDHQNGQKLDNQKRNLRPVTDGQNQANTLKWAGPRSSHFRGVHWNKQVKKWQVRFGKNPRRHIGLFEDEKAAARAYDAARVERYGEFAALNFPP